MSLSPIKVWMFILLAAVGAYGAYSISRLMSVAPESGSPEPARPLVLDARPRQMPELAKIKLVERRGGNFSFDRLQGEVWVGNMFFSSCPHTCTRLTAVVRRLHEELPQVKFVSISVDPDNDTPARLSDYAAQNHAESDRWFFVTGDMTDISRLSELFFGESIARKQHRDRLVVVDRQGRWHETFHAFEENDLIRLKKLVNRLSTEQEAADKIDADKAGVK